MSLALGFHPAFLLASDTPKRDDREVEIEVRFGSMGPRSPYPFSSGIDEERFHCLLEQVKRGVGWGYFFEDAQNHQNQIQRDAFFPCGTRTSTVEDQDKDKATVVAVRKVRLYTQNVPMPAPLRDLRISVAHEVRTAPPTGCPTMFRVKQRQIFVFARTPAIWALHMTRVGNGSTLEEARRAYANEPTWEVEIEHINDKQERLHPSYLADSLSLKCDYVQRLIVGGDRGTGGQHHHVCTSRS